MSTELWHLKVSREGLHSLGSRPWPTPQLRALPAVPPQTFVNDVRIPDQKYITLKLNDVIRFGYDILSLRSSPPVGFSFRTQDHSSLLCWRQSRGLSIRSWDPRDSRTLCPRLGSTSWWGAQGTPLKAYCQPT